MITGMKYLGKTTGSEKYLLEQYKGGGKYWRHHLAEHGDKDVKTIWYELFMDKEQLVEFADFLSKEANVVASTSWANIVHENGLDGGSLHGSKHVKHVITKRRIAWNKGITMTDLQKKNMKHPNNVGRSPWNKGKILTEDQKVNMKSTKSVESNVKRSAAMSRIWAERKERETIK